MTDAMTLLMSIADFWAPRCKGEGPHQLRRMGWYIPPFTEKCLILPPDLAYKHYRSLEPASIMESMIWTGLHFQIQNTKFFRTWIMDLISAALATDAILHEAGNGQDAVELGGDSGLLSAIVLKIFILNSKFYLRVNEEAKFRKAIEIFVKLANGFLPNTSDFIDLIWSAAFQFERDISVFGIESSTIRKLDSTIDWMRKRPTLTSSHEAS